MATKKKAAKPVAKKPVAKKAAPKPVKKAAPTKKVVKPAPKKAVKPVAKKPVAKAAAPAPKKQVKPVAKVAVKKAAAPKPVAKVAAAKPKAVVKAAPQKTAKPIVTPASKKPVAVEKPVQKPMAKKTEEKKTPAKEAPVSVKAIAKNPKDIKVAPPKPVVIPKITTKTSRKYQPDFTKSVLDQVKNDPGAPIVRYNDADLLEFRELIQRKLEAAKKELNYLQGLITRKDEMGGDESENRYMTMEDGSLSMEREQLSQMASRQITFIDHLEKAIMRIENKTYGICRVTGKLIDKARLRAVPHATLSIEAKMGIVK
jgi:RNA polymerase-binding transcription factor DksA